MRAIESEIKGQRFLDDYLRDENAIAFALARWFRDVEASRARANDRTLYPAFRFAAQAVSIIDNTPTDRRNAFIRRIHGAFRNPDDLRALELEFAIATHFARRGLSISWPEMQGSGRFDLMIDDVGRDGMEVEVKSVSPDKGLKIHRRDALVFNHMVRVRLENIAHRLKDGLGVVLTVPDRLPGSYRDRQELASHVLQAVLTGRSMSFENGADVRLLDFDIAQFPKLHPPLTPDLRMDVDRMTGTYNRQVMILGRKQGGALVFVVQSREEDSFLRYTFDTIARAAKQQLSGSRPGMILVGLEGISAEELVITAQQDRTPGEFPTALQVAVSEFLSRSSIAHVVGTGFLSRSELDPQGVDHVATSGSAYHFPRRESPFWHADFDGLFDER